VSSLTLLEQAQEHVGVKGPLVGFVHDDDRVLVQVGLVAAQELAQQHAVRHVCSTCIASSNVERLSGRRLRLPAVSHWPRPRTLDHRFGRRDVLKPNGVAHLGADLDLEEDRPARTARRLARASWHVACLRTKGNVRPSLRRRAWRRTWRRPGAAACSRSCRGRRSLPRTGTAPAASSCPSPSHRRPPPLQQGTTAGKRAPDQHQGTPFGHHGLCAATLVLANDAHQLVADGEHRKELALHRAPPRASAHTP